MITGSWMTRELKYVERGLSISSNLATLVASKDVGKAPGFSALSLCVDDMLEGAVRALTAAGDKTWDGSVMLLQKLKISVFSATAEHQGFS